MTAVGYLTVILCCQLAGEAFVTFFAIPVPGPVVGMVLLFAGLVIHGRVPEKLATVGDTLLANLSLLFVPAGVGVMLHLGLLTDDWLPISVALIASTVLTIAVTGLMMARLGRSKPPDDRKSSS
ncbi:MAG: CidA/LrgA family protein [Rhodospirillales bacterium]